MIPILRLLAASPTAQVTCPGGGTCDTGLPKVTASSQQLHEVLAIFFAVIAVVSVLMIIIGSLMFITSGGNSENATRARETIIYAVVGLVVALFAEGIVAWLLGNLGNV